MDVGDRATIGEDPEHGPPGTDNPPPEGHDTERLRIAARNQPEQRDRGTRGGTTGVQGEEPVSGSGSADKPDQG